MLSSAVKDVLDLFHKVLTLMTDNGLLKIFHNELLVTNERFITNAVDILRDIKELLWKLYFELSELSTIDNLQNSLDFNLDDSIIDYAVYEQLLPLADLSNVDHFENAIDKEGLFGAKVSSSPFDDQQLTDGSAALEEGNFWSSTDNNSSASSEQAQNLDSILTEELTNSRNGKFPIKTSSVVKNQLNDVCNSITNFSNRIANNYDSSADDLFVSPNIYRSLVSDEKNESLERLSISNQTLPADVDQVMFTQLNEKKADNSDLSNSQRDKEDRLADSVDSVDSVFCQQLSSDRETEFILQNTEFQMDAVINSSSDKENTDQTSDEIGVSCTYRCKECNSIFPTREKLNIHIESHGPPQYTCTYCGKKFTSPSHLATHKKLHKVMNNVSCFKCNQTFKNRSKLIHHLKIVHNGVRLPCSIKGCAKTFTSFSSMRQHVKWSHNSFKKLKCNLCDKELARKDSLNRHMAMVHPENISEMQKPYQCLQCKRSFTAEINYKQHLETHVQSHAKYSCPLCGQLFSNPDILKRHLNTHATYKGYTCAVCGHSFSLKKNLINHQLKHEQYDSSKNQIECEKCGKKFKSLSTLSFHTKMHEGKFMFKCHICNKDFVRRCHYKDHMLCHTENKPYKCPICDSSFKSRKYLKGHGRRVHKHHPNYKCLFESILTSGTNSNVSDNANSCCIGIYVGNSNNDDDDNSGSSEVTESYNASYCSGNNIGSSSNNDYSSDESNIDSVTPVSNGNDGNCTFNNYNDYGSNSDVNSFSSSSSVSGIDLENYSLRSEMDFDLISY